MKEVDQLAAVVGLACLTDPIVRVGSPCVAKEGGGTVELVDVVTLDCSEHGELDAAYDAREFDLHWLQKLARDHANAEHDGLVVAEGWAP